MLITVQRTRQITQFEPLTLGLSQDVEDVEPSEATKSMLMELDKQFEDYIARNSESAGVGMRPLAKMIVDMVLMKSGSIDEFKNLNFRESAFLNECKKEWKTRPEYKNSKLTSNVTNETNRK